MKNLILILNDVNQDTVMEVICHLAYLSMILTKYLMPSNSQNKVTTPFHLQFSSSPMYSRTELLLLA